MILQWNSDSTYSLSILNWYMYVLSKNEIVWLSYWHAPFHSFWILGHLSRLDRHVIYQQEYKCVLAMWNFSNDLVIPGMQQISINLSEKLWYNKQRICRVIQQMCTCQYVLPVLLINRRNVQQHFWLFHSSLVGRSFFTQEKSVHEISFLQWRQLVSCHCTYDDRAKMTQVSLKQVCTLSKFT